MGDDETTALNYCENQMRLMLAGEVASYDAAWAVWAKAASVTTSPELMHPLWLIWGALADWAENRPDEKAKADAATIRAAQEWLALPDATGRKAYLDRWVYDEMGYERTTHNPTSAALLMFVLDSLRLADNIESVTNIVNDDSGSVGWGDILGRRVGREEVRAAVQELIAIGWVEAVLVQGYESFTATAAGTAAWEAWNPPKMQ